MTYSPTSSLSDGFDLESRFWPKVAKCAPDQCWEWQGENSGGQFPYGRVRLGGKRFLAHRVAYETANGPIPNGLVVRHQCDNPKCCNPNHLLIGTHKDNVHDCIQRGRARRAVIIGTQNGRAKITADDVRLIRRSNKSTYALARELRISREQIGHIRNRRYWAHVTD